MVLINTQETNKYVFEHLGDAFRYGIINEMESLLIDSNDEGGIHFYASVAYMVLNGLISRDTADLIYQEILVGSVLEKKIDEIVESISKSIFRELIYKYHFRDMDDLVDILNEKIVPGWYFDIGMEVVRHCLRGIFLYEDYLYLISGDEGRTLFVKINPKRIDTDKSLDEQENRVILANGYSRIYGFDEKLKRVYLGVMNQTGFYHCYDMVTNDFVICSNELIFLRNGIPYVITNDKYVAYILGDVIHKVKKYYDYEKYIQQRDRILVVPKNADSPFFYPYCFTYDGKVVPADIYDCKKYIWSELEYVGHAENRFHYEFFRQFEENEKKVPMPKDFSIGSIIKAFKDIIPNSELCTNKKFIIFESMCDLLCKYIKPEDDVTHLLYVLYEIERVVRRGYCEFPSEELYWRFKEINECGEDNEKLVEAFKKWDYETIKSIVIGDKSNINDEVTESGLIGEFHIENNDLKSLVLEKCYGNVLGNLIVYSTSFDGSKGTVSYDCLSNMYYIISAFALSKEEKMQIIKDYKLSEDKYMFVVQKRQDI